MSTATPTVIVVEDEAKIRRFIKLALEAEQLAVFEADSVARGLIEVGTRQPDLVVLDLGLPDGDGIDLIRDLRTWSDIPIIVLSARTAEADKVAALDAGADDYLIKPFGAAELLARVRAHLRRRFRAGTTGMTVCEFGNVRVDLGKHVVEKDGQQIHLTPIVS
jgi:two-component system KDP operon response regulator KdpE